MSGKITAAQAMELRNLIDAKVDAAINYSWHGAGRPEDEPALKLDKIETEMALNEFIDKMTEG